jgi:hypothetical protein
MLLFLLALLLLLLLALLLLLLAVGLLIANSNKVYWQCTAYACTASS